MPRYGSLVLESDMGDTYWKCVACGRYYGHMVSELMNRPRGNRQW